MKQYISENIVNKELTDVQRSKLKHSLSSFDGWSGSFIKKPGLSIGQMIEFLADHKFEEVWMVFHHAEELCDDLWEAVRENLNGK